MRVTVAALMAASLLAGPIVHATPGPPGPKGAGTESRKWVNSPAVPPASMSPPIYPVAVQYPVLIPMRDGVKLEARLYIPQYPPTVKPGPCVLLPNGYGVNMLPIFEPELANLAQRGFAGVTVSMRGTGSSEGEAALYNNHLEDGYDLVEWMARQPWCDGNVGTIGASLLGITQWIIAKGLPPHLKAIIPISSAADSYWYGWSYGGMLPGPGRVARGAAEYDHGAKLHRDYDSWWRQRTVLSEDLQTLVRRGIAVMAIEGLEDYFLGGAVRGFEQMAGGQRKLVLPSVDHLPGGDYGMSMLPYDKFTYQTLWFDKYLKGIDNGIDMEPAVLVYVQGANQWRWEDDFPIPDTKPTRLYLHAEKSGSIASPNDGTLNINTPSTGEASVSLDYNPISGPFIAAGRDTYTGTPKQDQSADERNVLTWSSNPLTAPTELTGWINLSLWASSNVGDWDFVVQLSDVGPDQTGAIVSHNVTSGYLNAPHYFDRTYPPALVPGQIYHFNIEVWPTSFVFPAGHRIRIDVAGASKASPEQTSYQGPGVNPSPSHVTIYQDATHPSYLEVPVIGTATFPADAPVSREYESGSGLLLSGAMTPWALVFFGLAATSRSRRGLRRQK